MATDHTREQETATHGLRSAASLRSPSTPSVPRARPCGRRPSRPPGLRPGHQERPAERHRAARPFLQRPLLGARALGDALPAGDLRVTDSDTRLARTTHSARRDDTSRLEGGRARRAGTDRRADVLLAGGHRRDYGGYPWGRPAHEQTHEEMRRILTEVGDGSFTRELAGDFDNGKPNFTKRGVGGQAELAGQTGAGLRPLTRWVEEP